MTLVMKKFTMHLSWKPKSSRKPRFFLQNLPKPTDRKHFETVTTLARRALVCRRPHNFTQYRASMLNVWSHSAHTGLVDVQLNATMRLIFGTLCPISLPWLPVLTNIEPPPLRRKAASAKLVERAVAHDSWAIHRDILHPPAQWLPSRSQPWEDSKQTSQESGRKTGIQPRWSTPT